MNQLERNEILRKYQALPDEELQQILIDRREQLIKEEIEIIESILTRKRYKLEYKAEEETLEEKYEIYSDEDLQVLLQNPDESLDDEEIAIIEAILVERGYVIEDHNVLTERMRALEVRGGQAHLFETTGNSGENLFDLAESAKKDDRDAQKRYRVFYIKLDSKRLLKVYERVIKKIVINRSFGQDNKEDAIENYQILLTEVNRRKVDIPAEYKKEHNQAVELLINVLKKKQRKTDVRYMFLAIFIVLYIMVSLIFRGLLLWKVILLLALLGIFINSGIKHNKKIEAIRSMKE